jgi:hypothetical protein
VGDSTSVERSIVMEKAVLQLPFDRLRVRLSNLNLSEVKNNN